MKEVNVLLVEDNDEHASIISRHLRRVKDTKFHLTRESLLKSALNVLKTEPFDIVLLDLKLPDSDLHETLSRTLGFSMNIPVVVLSSLEERDFAIGLIQEGAQDYVCKSEMTSELLFRILSFAIERKKTEARLHSQMVRTKSLLELSQLAVSAPEIKTLKMEAIALVTEALNADRVQIVESSSEKGESSLLGDLHGISATIAGGTKVTPYGILYSQREKSPVFTADETSFLQTAANTLSAAIYRIYKDEELKEKIEELNEAHRRKDEFLATLSHELRTPLHVIIGYIEILKSTDALSADFSDAIAAIERNVKAETQLVSDTLELSRVVTGQMKLHLTVVDLNKVLGLAIEAVRFAAHAKNIQIERKIQEDLPVMIADELRLQQVFWNLLSNSVKFTPAGGNIYISAFADSESLKFSVSDNGKGIANKNIHHVFERFWQEDSSTSRHYMGMGLGLAIVRHIVELHGGEVHASSEGEGRGAQFSFHIPLKPVQVAAEPAFQPKILPARNDFPETRQDLSGLKVLIVDDSEDSLRLLQRLLEKSGATVICYSSPFLALESAKNQAVDLIVSDISMPGMDGYELIQSLREWEQGQKRNPIPAVALTAFAGESDAMKAIQAGFEWHFPKPIDFKLFKRTVASSLFSGVHAPRA